MLLKLYFCAIFTQTGSVIGLEFCGEESVLAGAFTEFVNLFASKFEGAKKVLSLSESDEDAKAQVTAFFGEVTIEV